MGRIRAVFKIWAKDGFCLKISAILAAGMMKMPF